MDKKLCWLLQVFREVTFLDSFQPFIPLRLEVIQIFLSVQYKLAPIQLAIFYCQSTTLSLNGYFGIYSESRSFKRRVNVLALNVLVSFLRRKIQVVVLTFLKKFETKQVDRNLGQNFGVNRHTCNCFRDSSSLVKSLQPDNFKN